MFCGFAGCKNRKAGLSSPPPCGRGSAQAFCPDCGSRLWATDPVPEPASYRLRVGTLDHRAELQPSRQYWYRSALPWTLGTPVAAAAMGGKLAKYVQPLYALRDRKKGYEVSVMKKFMDLIGLKGGPVRPPLEDVMESEVPAIQELVELYKDFA